MNNIAPVLAPKHLKSRRYMLGCLILLGLFAAYCIGSMIITVYPPLWAVKKITAIDFPESARLLNSHGRFFMEVDVWAKIEIDKADVEPFIKSLPPSKPISEMDMVRVLSHHYTQWWDPDSAKKSKFICFEKSGNGNTIQRHEIFIKLDDPHKAIVYMWYLND